MTGGTARKADKTNSKVNIGVVLVENEHNICQIFNTQNTMFLLFVLQYALCLISELRSEKKEVHLSDFVSLFSFHSVKIMFCDLFFHPPTFMPIFGCCIKKHWIETI